MPDTLRLGLVQMQMSTDADQNLHKAQDGIRVVPIILSDCAWQQHAISARNALPRGGKPVTSFDNGDEAWTAIVTEIAAIESTMASLQLSRSAPN